MTLPARLHVLSLLLVALLVGCGEGASQSPDVVPSDTLSVQQADSLRATALALLQEAQGDVAQMEEALPLLDAAIAADPDDALAPAMKYRLLVQLGREAEAVGALEQVAQRDAEAATARLLLGHLYTVRGDSAEAARWYTDARIAYDGLIASLDADPERQQAEAGRAHAVWLAGNRARALATLDSLAQAGAAGAALAVCYPRHLTAVEYAAYAVAAQRDASPPASPTLQACLDAVRPPASSR